MINSNFLTSTIFPLWAARKSAVTSVSIRTSLADSPFNTTSVFLDFKQTVPMKLTSTDGWETSSKASWRSSTWAASTSRWEIGSASSQLGVSPEEPAVSFRSRTVLRLCRRRRWCWRLSMLLSFMIDNTKSHQIFNCLMFLQCSSAYRGRES